MELEYTYADYAADKAIELIGIDSPSGYTERAARWVQESFEMLGFMTERTQKGGVLVTVKGGSEDGLLLEAHVDTLGGMVAEIKSNGRLRITNIGGMQPNNAEAENVRVYTRSGRAIEGTCQLCNASVHVNGEYGDAKRSFDTEEIVLDEDVKSEEDTRSLGIEVGDIVCFEPRARITESGYVKSRFLDDKLSVGILLGICKYIRESGREPQRPVYAKENDAASTYIDPSGECVNSLISDGCDIQGSIRNCILFRGVRVEKGAHVENSILFKNTVVRSGASIRCVIADKNVEFGPDVAMAGHAQYPLVVEKNTKL